MGLRSRIKQFAHAFNLFLNLDADKRFAVPNEGATYGHRPDRPRFRFSSERSIISSIYTRLGIDAAAIDILHVRVDDDGRFMEQVSSGLTECLTVQPNTDQGPRHFKQDVFMSLFEMGTIAIVPVDTSVDPQTSGGFNILSLRVGEVVAWHPHHVRVRLYNEKTGLKEDITLEKKFVAIAENPFYSVMNEQNSTLQRLIRKLNLLDVVDEQSSSGKLDIIIQLPYVIRSETKRAAAEQRRKDIEFQLKGSQYGIAYSDATEKITQLNRPAENNLLTQVEYLTKLLYNQLGLTEDIMNGTADAKAINNYYNRTIEPLVTAVIEAMRRAFLTKTARSQNQWIMSFRDPFKFLELADLAEIADKLTRNEIASPNDMRQAIGWKPAKDPKADLLKNRNMPDPAAPSEPVQQSTQ
jgi:hypothetical protein